jgi:phosphoglycerate dehydrogenase-like enzyme
MVSTVTILDDYQNVALEYADWSQVAEHSTLDVVTEHIGDTDALVERLAESDVVVAMRERTAFPADVLNRLPKLRLLITTGMGNASFDLDAARANGVVVAGTRGAGNAVPELTIGMMIAVTRHIAEEDRRVREGGWQRSIGPGLAGRTLGVLGLGRLGTPVAKLAQALQMDVVAWSRNLTTERAAEHGVRAVSKAELFERSHIVSIHVPLNESTRGIVGEAELRSMRPDAYLVNTSRGPIVDEQAMLAVLRERAIAGAALDVYDQEPLPVDHELRRLDNTLLLPHIGYVATDAYEVFYRDAVEDIVSFRAGRPTRVIS